MHTSGNDIEYLYQKRISHMIKVIGVGGAGTNAVNYMYEHRPVENVDYVVCNTDLQALKESPVPIKVQIGKRLTGGMGAGNKPETGRKAALEDMEEIQRIFDENTRMVFITAGMGGGTGTGAAPEIAKAAREKGILTVAVVTSPFHYEGPARMKAAREGIEKLRRHTDALLVVNNENLIDTYGDLPYLEAFHKSDEVLATAVESVSRVIMSNYHINVDFNDVETILRDSGTALLGTAVCDDPHDRATKVIEKALDSPLLNNNKITGAKNVLLLIVSGTHPATVREISRINEIIHAKAGKQVDIIMGLGQDPSLEKSLAVTVIATGFEPARQEEMHREQPGLVINVPIDASEPPAVSEPPVPKRGVRKQKIPGELSLFDQLEEPAPPSARQTSAPEVEPADIARIPESESAEQPETPTETIPPAEENPPAETPVEPETSQEKSPQDDTAFFVERFKTITARRKVVRGGRFPALTVDMLYERETKPGTAELVERLQRYVYRFGEGEE
ncbi:MAG: cell division protein FtsZ [Chlorobi bacterium]|nr:cell division protein FtsZ [Chlorobiota bacterium]